MTGIEQVVSHLLGDYVLQSHWMAQGKTSRHLPAALHALTYGIPFLIFGASWQALVVIVGTHFVIDRWRLAKYVLFAKNQLAPPDFRPREAGGTGYPEDTPPWLAVWLMIWGDNAIHLLINMLAIGAFP